MSFTVDRCHESQHRSVLLSERPVTYSSLRNFDPLHVQLHLFGFLVSSLKKRPQKFFALFAVLRELKISIMKLVKVGCIYSGSPKYLHICKIHYTKYSEISLAPITRHEHHNYIGKIWNESKKKYIFFMQIYCRYNYNHIVTVLVEFKKISYNARNIFLQIVCGNCSNTSASHCSLIPLVKFYREAFCGYIFYNLLRFSVNIHPP